MMVINELNPDINITSCSRLGPETSTTYKLQFNSPDHPDNIWTTRGVRKVHEYFRGKRRCNNCLSFKHSTPYCDVDGNICAHCGGHGHLSESCQKKKEPGPNDSFLCTNCASSEHGPLDPKCPVTLEINKQHKQKLDSYHEKQKSEQNYASALKASLSHIQMEQKKQNTQTHLTDSLSSDTKATKESGDMLTETVIKFLKDPKTL